MTRRALVIALAALAVLAAPATGQDAAAPLEAPGPVIKAAGGQKWPQRAFRLTLPEQRRLASADLQVTENGEPVQDVRLESADGAGSKAFGSILVIDASSSMHRGAIDAAIAAARELAAQRRGQQRMGVIVFNERARVVLEPTNDQAAIDRALAVTPPLADQTHIFDAVAAALELLRRAEVTAGSIVVLSDGADTGSRATARAVTLRARQRNVAIYAVGLRSNAFDASELRGLADAGRGQYTAAASPRELRRIFRRIGAELASDFLLTYRSQIPPGSPVTVAARLKGTRDVAIASYLAPGGEAYVQVEDTFWTSRVGLLATAGSASALVLFALVMLFARRRKPLTLQQRVRSFVTDEDVRGRDLKNLFTVPTLDSPKGLLERSGSWSQLVRDMEIARIERSPAVLVLGSVAGGIALGTALVVTSGLPAIGVFGLAVPLGARQYVKVMLARQRKRFTEQLPEVLQGAASAVRAGSGLVAALAMVAKDAPEPARSELMQVVADEALGVPLDQALEVVEVRMASRDVLQIALVAQIQRESGGNIAEVLDRITEALRQRGELRRMVSALTAQGRLSRWVVSMLPVALLLVIAVVSPDYVRPLFEEPLGIAMLLGALTLMGLGSVVIGKIVDFKV